MKILFLKLCNIASLHKYDDNVLEIKNQKDKIIGVIKMKNGINTINWKSNTESRKFYKVNGIL